MVIKILLHGLECYKDTQMQAYDITQELISRLDSRTLRPVNLLGLLVFSRMVLAMLEIE